MTLYVGETVTIVAECLDRRGRPLTPPPAAARVDVWAPGVARTAPPTLAAVPMRYDAVEREFVVDLDTGDETIWRAGRWTYRVTVADAYVNFEYFTFDLEA